MVHACELVFRPILATPEVPGLDAVPVNMFPLPFDLDLSEDLLPQQALTGFSTPKPLASSAARSGSFCFPCTPETKKNTFTSPSLCAATRGRFSFPCTPEAKKQALTSPSPFFCPKVVENGNRMEIELAIQADSPALLAIALLQRHQCCGAHVVFEAVKRCHLRALELLLRHGSSDFDEACNGTRPLHLALKMAHSPGDVGHQMVELLLRHGAKPGACLGDSQHANNVPLHEAAAQCNPVAMKVLLEHGADANERDALGRTALHMVVQLAPVWMEDYSLHKAVFGLLLRNGANPLQQDAAGRTPLQCTLDAELIRVLARAEKLWNNSELLCALLSHKRDASFACLELPEVLSSVGVFL